MTQLPATLLEAEALMFARDFIAKHKEAGGVFHPDFNRIYGKDYMKSFAQFHPFGADEIVYCAENGSKEADLALRELIAESVDRGEKLPAVLAAYNVRIINPMREAKKKKSGPGRAENFFRDVGITILVMALMDRFKLRPNRNSESRRPSRRPSASSIAAAALTEAKIDIVFGFKGVEKVWRRYLPVMARTPYALGSRFEAGFPAGYAGLFSR
jgi:hypothetical protein